MSSDTLDLGIDITVISSGAVPRVTAGAELLALTDALTTRFPAEPAVERAALVAALGEAAAERAIGVCATFQMMNRLLDGVGAPVRGQLLDIGVELGFSRDEITR